ncbi:hypothetical protein KR059_001034 [Drosophila kikkawai]|nr:hypothetical protein KR059_001034 [Drosophila kikkawai]
MIYRCVGSDRIEPNRRASTKKLNTEPPAVGARGSAATELGDVMEAAKSTSRQLARRRREQRGQRQEELFSSRMPDRIRRLTIAVRRPPATTECNWTSSMKPTPSASRQTFGHSSPYTVRGPKPSLLSQRSHRAVEPFRAAPAKNRQQHHQHKLPGSGTWWKAKPVKAKVDSHWLKPHHYRQSRCCSQVAMPSPEPGQAKSNPNRSLTEAHEQLELMLSRIERARDYLPPPPPTPATTTSRRRCGPMVSVRGGAKAKGVRRHMAQPPPAPPASPMNSARRERVSLEISEAEPVPLVHNPQSLMPAKRDALLELLQRREQHDRGMVDMVRSAKDGDHSARETMRMMLSLSLNESPYSGRDWKPSGSGCLKERQKLHQIESKELPMILRSSQGRTTAGELREGKPELMINMEEKIQQLNERQEQAMRERAELELHKQLVTICREKRRQRDERKQLAEWKKQQRSDGGGDAINAQPQITIRLRDPLARAPSSIPVPFDPWKQLLQERDRFVGQCNRSYFYNSSQSPAPWKIYAKVARKLSSQLMDILDAKFKQSIN